MVVIVHFREGGQVRTSTFQCEEVYVDQERITFDVRGTTVTIYLDDLVWMRIVRS